MFQFQDPEYLYLLLLLPILLLIYIWSERRTRRRLRTLGDAEMIASLMKGRSPWRMRLKMTLLLTAFALTVVLLARPQYGVAQQTDSRRGIETVVMVDVSNSMGANDVLPTRLDRSKLLLSNLVDRLKNDKIALGVFAGEAYPQLPITSDLGAAKLYIDALSPGMVTLQGTNMASAIELACNSFTDNKKVGKAVILITDAEDHEQGAEEAASAAAKKGINIFVIGVGTKEGSQIPTSSGPMLDRAGNPVVTALNEDKARGVAKAGKGIYLHLDRTGSAQEELLGQLARLKQSTTTTSFTARDEQFQAVALLILFLLIVEVLVSETSGRRLHRLRLFSK